MTEEEIHEACIANEFSPEQTQTMIDATEKVAEMINIHIPL